MTVDHRFELDPALTQYFDVRDDTILVRGKPVSVDLSSSSYDRVSVQWVTGMQVGRLLTVKLIPGAHSVSLLAGPAFTMTVTAAGEVRHDPALDGFLDIVAGTTLVVRGSEVWVDATATAYPQFWIGGGTSAYGSDQRRALRLVPGQHNLFLQGGPRYLFTVDPAGHVDYDPALDTALAGRGGTTLVVRGPVLRWAYALVNNDDVAVGAEFELHSWNWGTWRSSSDPAIAKRKATGVRLAANVFQIHLPELGSARGTAHVTATGAPGVKDASSCTVEDNRQDGRDQVITVGCQGPSGEPRFMAFNLLFTDAATSAGPAAMISYDISGQDNWFRTPTGVPAQTRRTGAGDYEVTVADPALKANGYVQVTPRGPGPVRCRNAGVAPVTAGVRILVQCRGVGAGLPVDASWYLTYAEGTALVPTTPGAYVQTGGRAPGLIIDREHSYIPNNAAMTLNRLYPGYYRVGLKGVGRLGDTEQISVTDSRPGYCHSAFWNSYGVPAGEVWVYVKCFTPDGKPADLQFSVATLRPPRAPNEPPVSLDPVDPGPHQAGPKWGHVRVTAPLTEPGIETQMHPDTHWSTWARRFTRQEAQWIRQPTVEHSRTGRYRVRLPGLASDTGIAHVTTWYVVIGGCSVAGSAKDGIDELVDVACFGPTGAPADWPFNVFFGEPNAGPAPMAAIRYGDASQSEIRFNSTGGDIRIEHVAPGGYEVTISGAGFNGRGYTQVTPLGEEPRRCSPTPLPAPDGQTRLRIDCRTISRSSTPNDSAWQLTYVQDTGLQHDPSVPAAYLVVDGIRETPTIEGDRTYISTGHRLPEITRTRPGRYLLTFPDIGTAYPYPIDTIQVTAVGGTVRCTQYGTNSGTAVTGQRLVSVMCHDDAGRLVDARFSLTYLRAP
jgi:hypothetical protein